MIPFLPNVFRLDAENNLHCDEVFSSDVLQQFFIGVAPTFYRAPRITPFTGPEIDKMVKEDMKLILPDNIGTPMPRFKNPFFPKYVKDAPVACHYASTFSNLIVEHGIDSHHTICEFTRLLFEEYFDALPDRLFVESTHRPNIHFISTANRFYRSGLHPFVLTPYENEQDSPGGDYTLDERLFQLVPFYEQDENRDTLVLALAAKGLKKLGMRSMWIQLILHSQSTEPLVTHDQLRIFYLKFLGLMFFYADLIPFIKTDGLYKTLRKRTNGRRIGAFEFRQVFYEEQQPGSVTQQDRDYDRFSSDVNIEEFIYGTPGCPPCYTGIVRL